MSQLLKPTAEYAKYGNVVDVDRLFEVMVDEFVEARKKIQKTLSYNFSKGIDGEKCLISYDNIRKICTFLLQRKSTIEVLSYPNDICIARTFVYSLTCKENDYVTNVKSFLESASKFGLDSPFPTNSGVMKVVIPIEKIIEKQLPRSRAGSRQELDRSRTDIRDRSSEKPPRKDTIPEEKKDAGPAVFKLDSSSALFAQHFSIIREMKSYCQDFREKLDSEQEHAEIWKCFDNICRVLNTGCQFLNFPVQI